MIRQRCDIYSFLFIVVQLCFFQVGFSQPSLHILGGTSVNLDTLYEGRTTTREVTIQNTGTDTLHISNIRTSCGCTVAKLAVNAIPPRSNEVLTVTFDSKDIQGDIKREVYISSNDSTTPETDITFRGTIITVIQVSPRYISFGKQHLHLQKRYAVKLKNTVTDTIRIRSCSSPDSQLHVQLPDSVLAPNNSIDMYVDVLPERKGQLLGQLELKTNSQLKPVVKISYIGSVR